MTATTSLNPGFNFPRESPLPPIRGLDSGLSSPVRPSTVHQLQLQQQQQAADDASSGFSSSKLTNVEAQRIMSVLVEAQRKVQLIGLLPDVMDRRMGTVFSADTFSTITELRSVEDKYSAAIELRGDSRNRDSVPVSCGNLPQDDARLG
ncbi:hypothetical protein DFS34DRAFT_49535 [Phlyctochytrium arcticum]|nr:hypothetical protein DFS34DRAFT_49535 [Phlyctochytrium arcticum]